MTDSRSWGIKLTPDQQWDLYCRAKQRGVLWTQAVDWAVAECGLDKRPSRSAFYRWLKEMDAEASRRRLEEAASATAEAVTLGKSTPSNEDLVATFKTLALKATIEGDFQAAAACLKNADVIHAQLIKDKTLDLARRRLKMLERAEKRETKPRLRLSPEEREKKMREILGLD